MNRTKITIVWLLMASLVIIGYADDAKDIKKLKKDVKKLKKEDKKISKQLEALNTNYEVLNQTIEHILIEGIR
jgi:UDP-N-acetylmuramyl pentapeptide phosphotransferase/UDP-N-acetylglucosamine-1-phosphate transferase